MLRLTLATALTAALCGCPSAPTRPDQLGSKAPADYSIPRQLRYRFTLRNTTGRALKKVELLTFAPAPQTSHQWLEQLTATQPYRATRDAVGNQVLHFELDALAPYASRIIAVTADLKMAEKGVEVPGADPARFTRPERYVESGDPRVAAVARAVRDPSPLRTVRRAYDWIGANVLPSGYVSEDRGARAALELGKGDCTEVAYLLAALARANQVPARPMGGYVVSGNAIVRAADYHNWAEVLIDGRWLIVDPDLKAFGERQADYVAMRIISEGESAAFNRYEIRTPGVEVTMN